MIRWKMGVRENYPKYIHSSTSNLRNPEPRPLAWVPSHPGHLRKLMGSSIKQMTKQSSITNFTCSILKHQVSGASTEKEREREKAYVMSFAPVEFGVLQIWVDIWGHGPVHTQMAKGWIWRSADSIWCWTRFGASSNDEHCISMSRESDATNCNPQPHEMPKALSVFVQQTSCKAMPVRYHKRSLLSSWPISQVQLPIHLWCCTRGDSDESIAPGIIQMFIAGSHNTHHELWYFHLGPSGEYFWTRLLLEWFHNYYVISIGRMVTCSHWNWIIFLGTCPKKRRRDHLSV